MTEARFRVVDFYWLFDDDREVLCGPIEDVMRFAEVLNAHPPADVAALRAAVQELMMTGSVGPFIPGPVLKRGET